MKANVVCTHLSLFVSNPEASARWYADVLGMQEGARGERWIMMSFQDRHHDIALIQAEEGAHQGGLGLQHYGLEIAGDMTTLRQLYGMLLDKNVNVVQVADHEIGNGIYFTDPDGNCLEFFLQTELDNELAKARFKAAGAPIRKIDFERL
jgi:catechol 2,3-dioxygenase